MNNIHQLITETVPVFFFTYNIQSELIEYVSPQFYNYVSNAEELKELDPHEKLKTVIGEEDQNKFQQFFNDLSKKNCYESSVELKAGTNVNEIEWFEFNTFHPVDKAAEPNLLVGHIVDITDKKKQYEFLKTENENIESVMNMMAHDLRAPFANVGLVATVLKKMMTAEEIQKYEKFLQILDVTSKDSGELINRLLYLATLKGETSKLDLDLHDLRYMVKAVVDKMGTHISNKNLEISFDFPDYSVEALLDVPLFEQVINNLLYNAIKFTPDGGKISLTLAYTDDEQVLFSIRDNGIGIPETHLVNFFKGISIIKRAGLKGEKSTGLGLYICQQIIKIHQGSISVISKEDEGSTFTVHLPIPKPSAAYY